MYLYRATVLAGCEKIRRENEIERKDMQKENGGGMKGTE